MMAEGFAPVMRDYQKHILVCTGLKCAGENGANLYQWMKERLRELGLHEGIARINRSQCHCFGVCEGGPLAVVYPEGIWYHHLNTEKMERIIQEHLLRNKPVKEYIFHRVGGAVSKGEVD